MSARILNLLAEPKDPKLEGSSASKQDQNEGNSEGTPLPPVPPPGLEKFGPPPVSGLPLAKAALSETVEDACLSSSDSTRFEEDGDAEPGAWYSQDWELSAWGQSYAYPPPPYPMQSMPEAGPFPVAPVAPAPSEGAILSTTPLHPPTLNSAPPSNAWEWPMPMPQEVDMMHGSYADQKLEPQPLMHSMPPMQPMPPMVHGVHYPMPDTTFLNYGLPVGTEMQSQGATLGSVGHETGNCKPCAFVYTKGCQSGAQCAFCHLCPPGEKDRRKKVKHIMARIRRKSSKAGEEQAEDE